jgi:hypothetical protein
MSFQVHSFQVQQQVDYVQFEWNDVHTSMKGFKLRLSVLIMILFTILPTLGWEVFVVANVWLLLLYSSIAIGMDHFVLALETVVLISPPFPPTHCKRATAGSGWIIIHKFSSV